MNMEETETSSVAEAQVALTHDIGLHARPAVKLTQQAAKFASRIELKVDNEGEWINAKSIVKVMRLKARTGRVLFFRATGTDADDAVSKLVALIESDFED